MKRRILYLQSGGPTSLINATLAGLLREGKRHDDIEILGARHGIEGVLDNDLVYLSNLSEDEIQLLSLTPSMYLGSSRMNLPENLLDPIYYQIEQVLLENNVFAVLVNGGNDSMITAYRLHCYFTNKLSSIQVVGIPKTIDNDLLESDHSLGFPSAALHVLNSVKAISLDARVYKKGKVQLIETMGRDTGWLAAASDLLPEKYHPDLILIPEYPFLHDEVLEKVSEAYKKKGYAIVVLSEGVNPLVLSDRDPFGHLNFEGAAYNWEREIQDKLHLGTRVNILSTNSRSDPFSLSKIDYIESLRAGSMAYLALLSGYSGVFLGLIRLGNKLYDSTFRLVPLQKVAGEVRYIPSEYLRDVSRMSDSFRSYLRPLLERLEPDVSDSGVFRSLTLDPEESADIKASS